MMYEAVLKRMVGKELNLNPFIFQTMNVSKNNPTIKTFRVHQEHESEVDEALAVNKVHYVKHNFTTSPYVLYAIVFAT